MSLGLVALFVDKNRHDRVSFVSAATVCSENLSVFRTVLPSRKFHVDSKSGSGKPLEKNSFVWFVLANSQSFRVVTVSGDYNSERRLIELWGGVGHATVGKEGGICVVRQCASLYTKVQ
jgi:hypothetical protein